MIVNVQNQKYGYDTKSIIEKQREKTAFIIFEPPMSRCDMCEIAFIPVIKEGEFPKIYTLGYYKDLQTAKDVLDKIYEALDNKQEIFNMPIA